MQRVCKQRDIILGVSFIGNLRLYCQYPKHFNDKAEGPKCIIESLSEQSWKNMTRKVTNNLLVVLLFAYVWYFTYILINIWLLSEEQKPFLETSHHGGYYQESCQGGLYRSQVKP